MISMLPENRVVEKRTALNDDMFSRLGYVAELYHLIEGIFNDRIRQPCGDVSDGRPFSFCACFTLEFIKTVQRVPGSTGSREWIASSCKIRNAHIHRLGVSLDKRSAAGRACFVEHNIIDRTVFDLDTFHVLSADVQDKIHIRQEGSGRLIMSDGLNLTVVGAESRLDRDVRRSPW